MDTQSVTVQISHDEVRLLLSALDVRLYALNLLCEIHASDDVVMKRLLALRVKLANTEGSIVTRAAREQWS